MLQKLVIGITIPGSVPLIRGQARYFVQKGYDVYLMCPRNEQSEKFCADEGCKLLDVKIERYMNPLKDIVNLFQIYSKLNKLKPDIINVGTPKMGLLGMVAAWMAGVKRRIYTCRGLRYEHEQGFTRSLLKFTESIPGKLAHQIICISPSVKEQALADKVFSEEKITVISQGSSNGVNLEKFNRSNVAVDDTAALKTKLDLDGKFVFGFVGRLINRKGINELYAAFSKFYEQYPDTRLVLVGKKDISQLYDKTLINKIENHEGIVWVGWQDNIPLYMSIFDVFVMPAWWEGFGNTYIEAANMGLPVIGSNGTGCRDAVKHNFNGTIVLKKDFDTLYDALIKYYTHPELVQQHGQNGPVWSQNFKQHIIWEGLNRIYQNQQQ
jgi:glycosyltransferase involved in cell wall biosynthesis